MNTQSMNPIYDIAKDSMTSLLELNIIGGELTFLVKLQRHYSCMQV